MRFRCPVHPYGDQLTDTAAGLCMLRRCPPYLALHIFFALSSFPYVCCIDYRLTFYGISARFPMYQVAHCLVQRGSLSPFTEKIANADRADKDANIPVPPLCLSNKWIFEKKFFYVAIERIQVQIYCQPVQLSWTGPRLVLIYQDQAYEAVARRSSMRPPRQGSRPDRIGLIILPRTRRRLAP